MGRKPFSLEPAYTHHPGQNDDGDMVKVSDVVMRDLRLSPDKAVIIEKAAESARRAEEHKAETGRYYDIPEQADYSEVLAEVERLRQKAKESESASN